MSSDFATFLRNVFKIAVEKRADDVVVDLVEGNSNEQAVLSSSTYQRLSLALVQQFRGFFPAVV